MIYNYEKLHKLQKTWRLMYADYVLDDSTPLRELIKEVGKTIDKDEFDTIIKTCPKYIIRRNHNLFTYDDIATKLAKEGNLALAKKVLLIFEKRCKIGGADYAYLAQRVYKITNDIRWCKRLFLKAKMHAEYEIFYINMLNFIKLKIISQNMATRFLNEILATTNFDGYFYCHIALKILRLPIEDANILAQSFYYKAIKDGKSIYEKHISSGLKHNLLDRSLACVLLDQNIEESDSISTLVNVAKIAQKSEKIGKKAVKKAIGLAKNTDDFVEIAPMAKKFPGKKETIKVLKQGYFLDETPLNDNVNYSCESVIKKGKATVYYKASHINTEKVNILEWMIKLGKRSWAKRRLDEMAAKKDVLKGANIYPLAGAMAKVYVRYFNDTKSAEDIFKKVAQNIHEPAEIAYVATEIARTIGMKTWFRIHCDRLQKAAKTAYDFSNLAECLAEYFLDFKVAQNLYLEAARALESTPSENSFFYLDLILGQLYKYAPIGTLRVACQSAEKSKCKDMGLLSFYYVKANDKESARLYLLKQLQEVKSYGDVLYIAQYIRNSLKDDKWETEIALDDKFLALPNNLNE